MYISVIAEIFTYITCLYIFVSYLLFIYNQLIYLYIHLFIYTSIFLNYIPEAGSLGDSPGWLCIHSPPASAPFILGLWGCHHMAFKCFLAYKMMGSLWCFRPCISSYLAHVHPPTIFFLLFCPFSLLIFDGVYLLMWTFNLKNRCPLHLCRNGLLPKLWDIPVSMKTWRISG